MRTAAISARSEAIYGRSGAKPRYSLSAGFPRPPNAAVLRVARPPNEGGLLKGSEREANAVHVRHRHTDRNTNKTSDEQTGTAAMPKVLLQAGERPDKPLSSTFQTFTIYMVNAFPVTHLQINCS